MQNLIEHIDNEAVVESPSPPVEGDPDFLYPYYYDSNETDLCWVVDDSDDTPQRMENLAPLVNKWEDVIPSAANMKFTIDSAKVD